jgi:hypothetical protein
MLMTTFPPIGRKCAPFDPYEVQSLREQQQGVRGRLIYTCPLTHDAPPVLVPGSSGLLCPEDGCTFLQTWYTT